MTWDEFIYALMLTISLLLGSIYYRIKIPVLKLWFGTLSGLTIVITICGTFSYHSILTVMVNGMLIFFLPTKYIHVASFTWCFGYLSFFRLTHWFGFAPVSPHSNAVQLLMTLKLVSISFDMKDTDDMLRKLKKEDDVETRLKLKHTGINPSPIEYFHYAFCYIGILTGPFYKFRTFKDMIDRPFSNRIPIWDSISLRVPQAPVYGMIYLLVSYFYTIQYVTTDEFYQRCFPYRLFYMFIMFFSFRLRMYFAWIMSEAVCMAAGLGGYPECSKPRCGGGPTDLEALELSENIKAADQPFNFDTIHNIGPWGSEFSITVKEAMKHWNTTVQYWLAFYVYKRVPARFFKARTSITMGVSAYWHGVKPGYFLSFFTIPLLLSAEISLARLMPPGKLYDFCGWLLTNSSLDYMAMGFLLLEFWPTMYYWGSIYFINHVFMIGLIVAGRIWPGKKVAK